jgi:hypothetical protein
MSRNTFTYPISNASLHLPSNFSRWVASHSLNEFLRWLCIGSAEADAFEDLKVFWAIWCHWQSLSKIARTRLCDDFHSIQTHAEPFWMLRFGPQARLSHQELEQGITRVVKLLACETKTHKQKLIQQHKVLKQVQAMQRTSKVNAHAVFISMLSIMWNF